MIQKFFLIFICAIFVDAIENRVFVGIGEIVSSPLKTHFSQSVTKDNNSCNESVCQGGRLSANYIGRINPLGIHFALGDEAIFDKYHISGLRIYASMNVKQVSLGDRVGEVSKQEAKDTFETIKEEKKGEPKEKKEVMLLSPKTQQDFLLDNALLTTFSLNLDFFANVPIGYLVNKSDTNIFGVFAGFGVEFSLLKSRYWINESLDYQQEGAFYASGNGLLVNFGAHFYFTKHDRIEVGVKIPFYQFKHEEWHGIKGSDTTNIWEEQTLRQTFYIKQGPEIRVAYIFYF